LHRLYRLGVFWVIILAAAAFAQEPYYSASGDTLYSDSVARIRALDKPLIESSSALMGSAGPDLISSTVWDSEIRLTYVSDSLRFSCIPFAAVCNDTVFVSFGLQMFWGSAPFLIASFDGGHRWSDIWCVSNDDTAQLAAHPFVVYYDNRLNLCGEATDTEEFNYSKTYSKHSDDLGTNWSEPFYFFERGQHFIGKQAGTSNLDTLIFGFFHQRDHHDMRVDTLKTSCSTDNGESWSDLRGGIHLYDNFNNYWFWLRYSMGRLHLLYQDSSSVEDLTEIFYAYSENWGRSWTDPIVVSDDSCQHSQWPYLFASADGKLIASWYDYKYGSGGGGFAGDILFRISRDNGDSWGREMQLTDHHEATASRSFTHGSLIGILWEDTRSGFFTPEFYYSESYDFGETWMEEVRLTNAPGCTYSPELKIENSNVFLFWLDARHNPPFDYELYFRTAEITETLVKQDLSLKPTTLSLNCYPNPFNSTVALILNGGQGGDAKIDIFDISGGLVKCLNPVVKEGGIKATWDATDNSGRKVSSGIYFARVETPQKSRAIKVVYLK
jgi:hypothetical protein